MKLIIAGGRALNIHSPFLTGTLAQFNLEPKEIVEGGANGVDEYAYLYATQNNIPVKTFPADWALNGKAAGPIRNRQMAEYADALLLIWDGESRGSASMKSEMKKLKKPIYEVIIKHDRP